MLYTLEYNFVKFNWSPRSVFGIVVDRSQVTGLIQATTLVFFLLFPPYLFLPCWA